MDLTWKEVQGMWNAFDKDSGILEGPDEEDLKSIRSRDIRNALEIDDDIWDPFIEDYRIFEAHDSLYWISTNECIYKAIEDSFEQYDVESFMEDLFLQTRSGALITAALEPLGNEAVDETFLYLANKEGNDRAVELVHNLLWKECLSDYSSLSVQQSAMYEDIDESDDQNSACLIGELYCKQVDNKYIFKDVFRNLVDYELDNFIGGGDQSSYVDGLGIAFSDYGDLEKICKKVCDTAENGGIRKNNVKPSACE